MKEKWLSLVLAGVIATVSGCQQMAQVSAPLDYSTGVKVSPEQMSSLKDNYSTKSDVVNLLGHPGHKSEISGREVWNYGYTFIPGVPFTGKKNQSETTVFEFNSRGVLVNHYKAAGNSQPNNALLNAAGM